MKPFFIVGTQHSGITLLRLMLNAHSKIAIPEEATFWMPLLRKAKNNYQLNKNQLESYLSYIFLSEQFKLWCFDGRKYADEVRKIPEITLSIFISKLYEYYAASRLN